MVPPPGPAGSRGASRRSCRDPQDHTSVLATGVTWRTCTWLSVTPPRASKGRVYLRRVISPSLFLRHLSSTFAPSTPAHHNLPVSFLDRSEGVTKREWGEMEGGKEGWIDIQRGAEKECGWVRVREWMSERRVRVNVNEWVSNSEWMSERANMDIGDEMTSWTSKWKDGYRCKWIQYEWN